MKKLDRLGWAAGLSCISYGARIGIRVNTPSALEPLVERFPPGWKLAPSPVVDRLYSVIVGGSVAPHHVRRFNVLYGNIETLARSMELDQVFDSFESNLQLYVAETARRRVFVHAGVVGWGGQAIVIPGRSFSGKTTLVAELVRAGATYYSDEYAVLDGRGRVHPYPKPMSIRQPVTGKQKKHPPEALGGLSGAKPLPVGMVVMSEYRLGARWRPRLLSAGQGALALLSNAVSARRQPHVALATLKRVVSQAPVLKGVRGEAKEVVDSLLKGFRGGAGVSSDTSRRSSGKAVTSVREVR
jgi:hypothetical protein